LLTLAGIYSKLGNTKEEIKIYERIIKIVKNPANKSKGNKKQITKECLNNLGNALRKTGKIQTTIESYTKTINLDKEEEESPNILVNLSACFIS